PVAEKLPEMAPAPVGAIAAVAREPEPEVEEPAPVSRSLEEQAAALRAAMAKPGASVSAPPTPPSIAPKEVAADSNGRNGSAGSDASAVEDASGLERRPFGPKRTTPLKSRLAGTTEGVSPAEGETFSERSAELEQLLRHRDD